MTFLTSLPSGDLHDDSYELSANLLFGSAVRAAHNGMPGSGMRVSDEAVFSGADRYIYCTQGPGGLNAIAGLYREGQGRASTVTTIQDFRFGFGRYGIITPFDADRPPNTSSPESWYYWGEHVVRRVQGQAYEKGVRIAGQNTLIEDFNLHDVGGVSAEPEMYKRASAITLHGPNPVVRRGLIRRMAQPATVPTGHIAELTGISFEQDCNAGTIEDVRISNPVLLPDLSIGVWVGHSLDVTVRNVEVKNFSHALYCSASPTSSGLVESCRSFDCTQGYAWAMAQYPEWKFKDCWDFKMVSGVWTATEVSNV